MKEGVGIVVVIEIRLSSGLVRQVSHADHHSEVTLREEETVHLVVTVTVTACCTVEKHTVTGAVGTVGSTGLQVVKQVVQVAVRPVWGLDADVVGIGQGGIAADEEPLVVGCSQFVAAVTEIRTVVPVGVAGSPIFVVP